VESFRILKKQGGSGGLRPKRGGHVGIRVTRPRMGKIVQHRTGHGPYVSYLKSSARKEPRCTAAAYHRSHSTCRIARSWQPIERRYGRRAGQGNKRKKQSWAPRNYTRQWSEGRRYGSSPSRGQNWSTSPTGARKVGLVRFNRLGR